MTRTGVFYLSHDRIPDGWPIPISDGRMVWIRVEEVDEADLVKALDRAAPRAGETVMNTHPLHAQRVDPALQPILAAPVMCDGNGECFRLESELSSLRDELEKQRGGNQ